MRAEAYGSLNTQIQTIWAGITTTPVVFDHPTPPAVLPASCLRVTWFGYGGPGVAAGMNDEVIQLDIFLTGAGETKPVKKALALADALDAALGLETNLGLKVFDVTDATGTVIGRICIKPDSAGWQNIPTATLRQAQLSRRIYASWNAK